MKRPVSGVVTILLCLACGMAAAGPYEDGKTALNKKDYAAAFQAFSEGAKQGDVKAQTELGILYFEGQGVAPDTREGIRLLTLAADKGYAPAQGNLAKWYANSRKISNDVRLARRLATAGAQQNDGMSQYVMGLLYSNGLGVPQDFRIALDWLNRAASQNVPGAQTLLGYAYHEGEGVAQDYIEAVRYFRLAAQQDEVAAQAFLGLSYALGRGVRQDFARGYMWLNFALAGDLQEDYRNYFSRVRTRMTVNLDERELARGQAMGRQCKESNYENCGPDSKGGSKNADVSPDGKPRMAGSGTGFYISAKGHVVTNHHVIEGCKEIRSPRLGVLKLLAADKTSDLALLGGETVQQNFAKLRGGRGARLGENIVAIGYPLSDVLGSDVKVTTGSVSSLSGIENDRNRMQISAPIQPGNSGGPIIGEDGSLVGVAVAVLNSLAMAERTGTLAQNVNFAVSLGTLQSFLNTHAVPYVFDTRTARLTSSDIATEATQFTMFLECWK